MSAKGKRWQAIINYDSKHHYLGTFDTKQEAALAYDREARQRGKAKFQAERPMNYESIAAAEYDAEYGWCVFGSNSGSDSEQAQPLSFLSNMEVETDAFGDLNTDTDAFGDLAGVYIEVDLAIFHMFASTTPASTHVHTPGTRRTHLDLSSW